MIFRYHRTLLGLLGAISIVGCDSEPSSDAGIGSVCASAADCDDGLFCSGAESCDPDAPGADARGCVSEPACPGGAACDEDADDCGAACSAPDADGDGHDAVACGGDDCDDTDPRRFAGNVEVCDPEGVDEDCDPTTFGTRDIDGDGHVDARCCNAETCGEDCDETRRGTNPDVPEVCDGRDNDCDGVVDEELLEDRYTDADRDLHGDGEAPVMACPGRAGTSASMLDCDDGDPMTNGPQTELRDGKDNDCDGEIDEVPVEATFYPDTDGDGYGDPEGTTVTSDAPVAGYAILPIDCDDTDAARSPVAAEVCDAIDNDCDGEANFEIGINDWEDDDGDGVADAACGGADCDDTDPSTFPGGAERCDQRDNDCDGAVDEDCGSTVLDAGAPDHIPDGGPAIMDDEDAGSGVLYCTADPPVVPSSGTGTALHDGSTAFAVAESVATHTGTGDATSGYTHTVRVVLTGFPNWCGLERDGQVLEEGRGVVVTLVHHSMTIQDAPPPPGTYPLLPHGEPLPEDTWVFLPLGGYHWYSTCRSGPSAGVGPGPNESGSVTLTAVSETTIEGSYSYNQGHDYSLDRTGTFAAPFLTCEPAEPDAELCCRASTS